VPAELHDLLADTRAPPDVEVVEIREEPRQIRGTVRGDALLHRLEEAALDAAGVVGRLEQERRNLGSQLQVLAASFDLSEVRYGRPAR
jgi:hypothetical protein